MMKKTCGLLILSVCTLALSGCMFRRFGPCYGFGCPALAGAPAAAPQTNAVVASHADNGAPAANASADSTASAIRTQAKARSNKPHGFAAFLANLLPSHHTGVPSVPPSPGQ